MLWQKHYLRYQMLEHENIDDMLPDAMTISDISKFG